MKTSALAILMVLAGCAPSTRDPGHGNGGSAGQGGAGGSAGQGGSGGSAGSGGGAGKAGCGKSGATFGGSSDPWTNPVVQCHWTGGGRNVVTTPLVIDLDGDGKPEIVFTSSSPGDSVTTSGVRLHAIRGGDCTDVWSVTAEFGNAAQLAAGDLDADGKPEIVGYDHVSNVVRVFDGKGGLLASSDAIADWNPGSGQGSGPAIADIDGTPPAEIVLGAAALRLSGGSLTKLWSKPADGGHWGTLSLVADVDLDGSPDLVSGNRIWDAVSGGDKTPSGIAGLPGGYAAVAQIDAATPEPEIVLVSSQAVTGQLGIYSATTGAAVFGPYPLPDTSVIRGVGGGPVVADFDGDGHPEVGVSTPSEYRVYDPDCAASPLAARCAEPGVLWKSTTRDESSGGTSSSVFDFNNDCEAEVVYRDECWLRIYEGKTGKVLAAYAITSGTALEEPVIADVDGDGHAEIVVSSDNIQEAIPKRRCPGTAEEHTGAAWTGYTQGVFVMRDAKDPERWAPARRVWNQNSYHVTNVNEDGSVPAKEPRSWETVNSYRQNAR